MVVFGSDSSDAENLAREYDAVPGGVDTRRSSNVVMAWTDHNSGGNTILNNTVDGSILVNDTTGFEAIFDNLIGHTLECNDDTPPPSSAANTASNFVGQCTG
jgi:hypothetical protein